MAVVAATAEVDAKVWLCTDVVCLHIQRCTKGTGTVGGCSYTTLYLHRLHTAGEVAHVDPKKLSTLGIVHGDAVGCDVDAAGVCATNTQCGVADAVTSVAGHRHRGCQRQQEGNVLAVVDGLQLFLVHVGKGHRRLARSSRRYDLYVLQLYAFQRVQLCVHYGGMGSRYAHQCHHEKCSHFFYLIY